MNDKLVRYRFEIPTPSAKRLLAHRYLVVRVSHGFGCDERKFIISENSDNCCWEGPEKLEFRNPHVLDGDYGHQFWIEFNNTTHTRTERIEVQPVLVEGKTE